MAIAKAFRQSAIESGFRAPNGEPRAFILTDAMADVVFSDDNPMENVFFDALGVYLIGEIDDDHYLCDSIEYRSRMKADEGYYIDLVQCQACKGPMLISMWENKEITSSTDTVLMCSSCARAYDDALAHADVEAFNPKIKKKKSEPATSRCVWHRIQGSVPSYVAIDGEMKWMVDLFTRTK